MELDSRIIKGKRPLTCFDIDEAEKYVGKKCYISNEYDFFRNLDFTKQKILNGVEDCEEPFHYDQDKQAEFCLPGEWVEQKSEINFEQYHLETFKKEFNIGDVVTFKGKSNTDRAGSYYECIYFGYRIFTEKGSTIIIINLGLWGFTFSELFDLYEICRNGTWEPFGRKVENIDICAGRKNA